jgi:hypothetical protein
VVALAMAIACLGVGCSSEESGSTSTQPATSPPPARGTDVASPEVSGPVTGGTYDLPYNPVPARLLEQYNYRQDEYLISGTATAYQSTGTWATDGQWSVTPAATAPYKTRMVVRRPADDAAFNGTVIVEWLNVTAGMDADPDFGFAHDELMREGYAYVVFSAQSVGVEGGGVTLPIEGFTAQPLKEWDSARYGSLDHPGDEYSYDMYSQAARALRQPSGLDPLDGLVAQRVIATGESQSAGRLVTYVNAVHPVADIYDGFLIHSRGDNGAAINPNPAVPAPPSAHIRTDLDDPVLQVETETDLFGLGFYDARQPDAENLLTWEIAGTAHADTSQIDYGFESGREWNLTAAPDFTSMCGAINDGPQKYIVRTAFIALDAWVAEGAKPSAGDALEVVDDEIVRDEYGNALGGIRTPAVDVPIATISGEPDEGESVICSLFGSTTPFDEATLLALYPTHEDYVREVTSSADDTVAAGFLLPSDRDEIVGEAEAAPVPT